MKSILGMGNALTDILALLPDESLLEKFHLPHGSMQHVDAKTADTIWRDLKPLGVQYVAGGSAANTITGTAVLGMPSGFVGKVGDDELGSLFYADQHRNGIKSCLLKGEHASGRAMVFVTGPDADRTFAVYLGAALELGPDDLIPEMFHGYDYFHIEGYLVQNHELILKAVQMAKEEGLKVALDLASYNVVEDNLAFLNKIIASYVDIVFANEEEAKALTGLQPAEALESIAAQVEIAIVKIGEHGAMAIRGNERVLVPAVEANCIDTTGAGDLFAAGFIYGMSVGRSLVDCARYGTITAGKVIEVIGPKMTGSGWDSVRANF